MFPSDKSTVKLEAVNWIECIITHAGNFIDRHQYVFTLCDSVTMTFDLILIDWRGLVVDYSCDKFRDCSFSRFGFIVRTNRQTHTRR